MKGTSKFMFIFGVLSFGLVTLAVSRFGIKDIFILWSFRVLLSLAAAAISISIPGLLEIRYVKENGIYIKKSNDTDNSEPFTLADKEPTITASGAIAVFVLVYLFNPANF